MRSDIIYYSNRYKYEQMNQRIFYKAQHIKALSSKEKYAKM